MTAGTCQPDPGTPVPLQAWKRVVALGETTDPLVRFFTQAAAAIVRAGGRVGDGAGGGSRVCGRWR